MNLKKLWFNYITLKIYFNTAETFGDMVSYAHLGTPVNFNYIKNKLEKLNLTLLENNLKPYTIQELNENGWSGQKINKNLESISQEEKQIFLKVWKEDDLELNQVLSLNLFNKL